MNAPLNHHLATIRAQTASRIDLEPLYTALKSAVGDTDWTIYKEAIRCFVPEFGTNSHITTEEMIPLILRFLDSLYLQNYPADDIEFGTQLQPETWKHPSVAKSSFHTSTKCVIPVGHLLRSCRPIQTIECESTATSYLG